MAKNNVFMKKDSDFIEESMRRFLSMWCEKMPETAQVKNTETHVLEGCKQLVLQLDNQFMVDEFTNIIASKLNLHILAIAKIDESTEEAMLYCTPCENCMYTIKISSKEHGVVDNIIVSFYHSLEMMYTSIKLQYLSLINKRWSFSVCQKPADILSVFY